MIALWMGYATLVGAILATGAAVFERSASGSHHRRWISMGALVLSVAVPAWTVFVPRMGGWSLQPNAAAGVPESREPSATSLAKVSGGITELIARADTRTLQRLDTSLAIAWTSMALLAVGGYGVATWSLARRRRSWRRTEVDGERVLLAPMTGPAVIGALRPQIVVPEWSLALSAPQRALMLEHERQHVRANDPLLLHAAALVALLMPWNLAAWWLNRRLRLAVELDCDARVLARGHDAREYGTLLLDVCARRPGTGLVLAPALFERTSSLTKRILAMQPHHPRFPRARLALGIAGALAVAILACEVPSPEALAPDGKDVASKRLYGQVDKGLVEKVARSELTLAKLRATVAQYFPSIARGEGGPSILYLVRSQTGEIVLTEAQAAAFARTPALKDDTVRMRVREKVTAESAQRVPLMAGTVTASSRERIPAGADSGGTEFQARRKRLTSALMLPRGVGALRPDDIATIDIVKHAAGVVAPNPVSIISIVLKPGVKVPPAEPLRSQ